MISNNNPEIFNNPKKMRNKSPSPMGQYPTQISKKYYSREQVSQILRTMFQNKLTHLYQQLDQKQQIIRTLNEKLNHNDLSLQNGLNRVTQLVDQYSSGVELHYHQMQELVERGLTEKIAQYWQLIQEELEKIRQACFSAAEASHNRMQARVDASLADIKRICEQGVENFKKKNNVYWAKVKEALNKLNARTVQCEQKTSNIGLQINKFEAEREQNSKAQKQIQNCKNTAKMLVELKKSVNNVYKNFEEVLKIQKNVKEGYEKMGSIDKWSYDKVAQRKNSPGKSWNFPASAKNGLHSNHQRQEDIVILEYSVQQDTISNHQMQNQEIKQVHHQDALIRQHAKSLSFRNSPKQSSSLAVTQNEGAPLSPITGRVIENSNYSNTGASERFKTTAITSTSINLKNETYEWHESEQANMFHEMGKHDRSDSFQLAPHVNHSSNSRLAIIANNNTSASMLNFSLECRKQTVESVRPRLLDMIETKGLSKPIRVLLDQISYLKNEEGNYLFDLKGNMFKLSPTDFAELQRQGIIAGIKQQQKKPKN